MGSLPGRAANNGFGHLPVEGEERRHHEQDADHPREGRTGGGQKVRLARRLGRMDETEHHRRLDRHVRHSRPDAHILFILRPVTEE
jgi:hypothetical protein